MCGVALARDVYGVHEAAAQCLEVEVERKRGERASSFDESLA